MIVYRVTEDMFEFASVTSLMANPVNLVGAPGKGLALEFAKRIPSFVEQYKAMCAIPEGEKTSELRVGTVKVIKGTGEPWDMLLFPTKRHWADASSPDDIKRGLRALREMLLTDEYRHAVVGMPMLGCGLGLQDYPTIQPLMEEYLGDIEATIFLSMSPKRTELRPRYLTIVGPLDYGVTEEQQANLIRILGVALEKRLEMRLEDYTNVVSGGYPGADSFFCGTEYGKAVSDNPSAIGYQDSYIYKQTGKMPLVVKPDKARYGISASLHQGNLLGEIGDDVILLKPKGHNNNRVSAIQVWLQSNNEERERTGMIPRRVVIVGDTSVSMSNDDFLIPQTADIPY